MNFDCPEDIKPRVRAAAKAALATRGPRKGFLVSRCPAMGTDAAAFWQAAMMTWNPYKVSIPQLMLMPAELRAFHHYCEIYCEALAKQGICLDLDRMKLARMGAW